jgi:NTP pyrophosphatase (non-canonical NTP hydrolase)
MEEITRRVIEFRDKRNWSQFHNPKDLALSLSLEASELLENFQWKSSEEAVGENFENIKDELADVLIYSILMAEELNIDLIEAVLNKIKKNHKKYPIEKAVNSKKKYNKL